MVSPIPKHLTTDSDHLRIAEEFREHRITLTVDQTGRISAPDSKKHKAKYAPGLATELMKLADSNSIGDPMAGTGTLAYETGKAIALNDIDIGMSQFLDPLISQGCIVSYLPAHQIEWSREFCIFSPPYYPRTDRKKPNVHDDEKRGPVVGFRDSYDCDHRKLIGNPSGSNGIAIYREQMSEVYRHMKNVCENMIVVTKNWTRLGTELRLDLDTILMCQDAGWICKERHGWVPPKSLWSRFNEKRGTGVQIEDVTIFTQKKS